MTPAIRSAEPHHAWVIFGAGQHGPHLSGRVEGAGGFAVVIADAKGLLQRDPITRAQAARVRLDAVLGHEFPLTLLRPHNEPMANGRPGADLVAGCTAA